MIAYRSTQTAGGGQNYAATYTGTVNNKLVKSSAAGMFYNNRYFNSEIFIGDNVGQCSSMLEKCNNFNSEIHFGKNVINAANMLYNCNNFNLPLVLGNKMVDISGMLDNCLRFNHDIIIPDSVENCSYLFIGCSYFNSNIKMSNNARNCYYMLASTAFNRPFTIPESAEDCEGIFYRSPFNQDIIIPENVTSISVLLAYDTDFGKNIYVKGLPSCTGMLGGKSNSKRVNIFCTDASNFIDKENGVITIWQVDNGVNWTPMTNGYYNSTYNVYIYDNYVW